ncbi:hypothetical protein [Fastidiosibacter lacustris]|uniref:hypothetical protein n=1 Tax=Fastidiosibacter lacustris TaxID=2056695 RepID=UPI000E345EED|nr:hypothetical protein [Fastidiosibacter lacustris]
MKKRISQQSGFVIVPLLIAVAVVGILSIMYYWKVQDDHKKFEAQMLGNQIAEYISAVIGKVSGDRALADDTYTGFDWLKATNCNDPLDPSTVPGYLTCTFSIHSRLLGNQTENNFQVIVDPVTESLNNNPTARRKITITLPTVREPNGGGISISPYLGSVVFNTARARYGVGTSMTNIEETGHPGASKPSIGNMPVYHGIAEFKYNKATAQIEVESFVTNTDGIWLQIDGTNSMVADISYNKPASNIEQTFRKRGIVNISRIENFNKEDANEQEALDKQGPSVSGYIGTKDELEDSMRINASKEIYIGNQVKGLHEKTTNVHIYDMYLGAISENQTLGDMFKNQAPTCKTLINDGQVITTRGSSYYMDMEVKFGPSGKSYVEVFGSARHDGDYNNIAFLEVRTTNNYTAYQTNESAEWHGGVIVIAAVINYPTGFHKGGITINHKDLFTTRIPNSSGTERITFTTPGGSHIGGLKAIGNIYYCSIPY